MTAADALVGAPVPSEQDDREWLPFDDSRHHRTADDDVRGEVRLGDFWAWAFGNVMTNTTRGILAEYLVARALGVEGRPREDWGLYDLEFGEYAIEVKSAGRLQAWPQRKLSVPAFGCAPHAPDATLPGMSGRRRWADCFVFCLFTPVLHAEAAPLDPSKWLFYVVAARDLPPALKSVSSKWLDAHAVLPVAWAELGAEVSRVCATGEPEGIVAQVRMASAELRRLTAAG